MNNTVTLFDEISKAYPYVFKDYEALMHVYYNEYDRNLIDDPIPKAQLKALLILLDHLGYIVSKKPILTITNNIIKFER